MDRLRRVIEDLGAAFAEIDNPWPPGMADFIEAAICRDHGGETIYIKRLPKTRAELTGELLRPMTQKEIALEMGLSVRHVRRLQRGK